MVNNFRTSTFCAAAGCVEVAYTADQVAVRGTGQPEALRLAGAASWSAFIACLKSDAVRPGE